MAQSQIEKVLEPMWGKIMHIDRDRKYGSVEVQFRDAAISRAVPCCFLFTSH